MNQTSTRVQSLGSFVWSIAEILRGDFKQSEYGKVILPFIVMRRLDCILEGTKPALLAAEKGLPKGIDDETRDMILFGAAGDNIRVYNTSRKADWTAWAIPCRSYRSRSSPQNHTRPKRKNRFLRLLSPSTTVTQRSSPRRISFASSR
jgi:hypothetical protein